MNNLVFAQPNWFWGLLLLLPLLALRIASHSGGRKSLSRLVSPRLIDQLVSGSGQAQKWTVFVFHSLALAGTLTALARPQLGFDEVDTQTEARNLIVAIDTSRSMLATDLRPNRLERAKLAAIDIIRALPEDRIGLIAFAGRPFLQAPLTVDHEAILEAIDQMDTEIIPRGGTNLVAAAQLALETFSEADLEQSALVLFSDGEALEGTAQVEQVRKKAREAGMSVIAVGVGTEGGAIIPELSDRGVPITGQFVMDDQGQVVRSRLDLEALQALAAGGGIYVHLGGQSPLTRVVQQIQQEIATSRAESETRRRPIERFMWPLSLAVALLILTHLIPLLWIRPQSRSNRGIATLNQSTASRAILIGFLFVSALSFASAEDPLFLGHKAYQDGDYEKAIETYEEALSQKSPKSDETRLRLALGAAAFRQGDYERASEAYGNAIVGSDVRLREHAHYNLGNTLFRQGEASLRRLQSEIPDESATYIPSKEVVETTIRRWESAIEHYETALTLNQTNERAPQNINVVKKRIEELKKQQEEEEKNKDEEEKDDEKDEEKEDSPEEDEDPSGEQEQKPNSKPSESEQDLENSEDEPKENESDENPKEENENSENEGDPEDSDKPETDPNEDPSGEPEEPQDPGNQEGDSDDASPKDGKLEAKPNQQQPPSKGNPASAAEQQVNPQTGYSPTEARQLLEALADETEVRPILAPARGEKYKNW